MGLLPVPHQDFYLIDIKMGCTTNVHPILLYNRNCIYLLLSTTYDIEELGCNSLLATLIIL